MITTPAYVGPGCYDLSKDGKSVAVQTEKRVRPSRVVVNPFLTDWRTYMQLGSTQSASPRCNRAGDDGGKRVHRKGGGGCRYWDRKCSANLNITARRRQRKGRRDHGPVGIVPYALETRRFRQGSTHLHGVAGGERNRHHNPPQQHSSKRAWDGAQDPSRNSENNLSGPSKRGDPAHTNPRDSTVVTALATQQHGSVSGLGSGSGSTAPKFVPHPPSIRVRARPRTAGSARTEDAWDKRKNRTDHWDPRPYSNGDVFVPKPLEICEEAIGKMSDHNIATATTHARHEHRDHDAWKDIYPKQKRKAWSARRRPASASRTVRSSNHNEKDNSVVAPAASTEVKSSNSSNIWLDGGGDWTTGCRALRAAHARRATAGSGAASQAAAAIRASVISHLRQEQQRRHTIWGGGLSPRSSNWTRATFAK